MQDTFAGFWTRSNDVEIDVVGADRGPIAKELYFLGSIKWLENAPFDDHELRAISRSGTGHADAAFDADDLIEPWTC
ncbi:MAG TPA: hypothetical protein VH372_08035 [Actinospica sp.]|nr:hypothetical protein [Actinospica sp.]